MQNEKLYTKEEYEEEYKRGLLNGRVKTYNELTRTANMCNGLSFETAFMLLLKEIEQIGKIIEIKGEKL